MAKDLLVSIGIGVAMQTSAKTVFQSTVKHLDDLGKAIKTNEQASARIAGYRKLEKGLGETQAAARRATERVAKLGAAMRKTEQPSRAMRQELGQARRFTDRVGEQTRALAERRRELRRAKIDVRDLTRAERELGGALERQRKQFDRLSASRARQAGARQQRGESRARLVDAVALGYPLVRAVKSTIGAAVRFESVMADVRKVVDFETPEQFRAMGRDIGLLSTRLPVAATGIGEIVAAAGQAGIARHELLRFTEDAAKMAVAFDMGAAEAGGAMTGMRSIFKLNQSQVMDLAGAYNHLSNNMDATAADMLRVANRAGPTAQQMFRLTGQELGALGATFLELKTPPEVAGTAINAMLTKLATADEQGEGFRRSIPAGAGEPQPGSDRPVAARVYPRRCGGTGPIVGIAIMVGGLSPQVRGEPPDDNAGTWPGGVYPRRCGGTTCSWESDCNENGLSPQVRGNLIAGGVRRAEVGSIPAGAGEPAAMNASTTMLQVYPRRCGGTAIRDLTRS